MDENVGRAQRIHNQHLQSRELTQQGWKTAGAAGHIIAAEIKRPVSGEQIGGLLASFIQEIAQEKGEEYVKQHVRKIGSSIYIHPEVKELCKQKAEKFFESKKTFRSS